VYFPSVKLVFELNVEGRGNEEKGTAGDGAAGNEHRTKLFTDSNVLSAGR
jgi:hypothetical protein